MQESSSLFQKANNVCFKDTGCKEKGKLRATESPSSAEKQLWGQKGKL